MGDSNAFRYRLSPWQPEQNKLRLALLGKLAEELAEANAIVARCIIQGIDETEPSTGKSNRESLEDELADVYATSRLVEVRFRLDGIRMYHRQAAKQEHLGGWHLKLEDDNEGMGRTSDTRDRIVGHADGLPDDVDGQRQPRIERGETDKR